MLLARENPFRAGRIEALRYRLDEAGWHDLLSRFAAQGWRGLLVGPHGSGKTTLREEIERRLITEGWQVRSLVIREPHRRNTMNARRMIAGGDEKTLLTIDGLDRLGAVSWLWLRFAARRLGGILATSHTAGRLPTLRRHDTSPELLAALAGDLLGLPPSAISHERCATLFRQHRGDLRACFRSLYDGAMDVRV